MFFRKNFSKDSIAQGTIEYLVIIAVVVVISLIVVGLFITVFDSPSQEITDSSSQAGAVATGGISIVESVIDPEGDSIIRLSNNSSDAITLTKITVGGVDNNFSEQLVGLDSKVFSLSSLNSSCPCVSGQKSVKCELKIIYTTINGTTQTEYRTINAQCVSDSTPVNPTNLVDPIRLNCFDITANPIQICSLQDLNQIRTKLDGNYILIRDINATPTKEWNEGEGWEPIGDFTTRFTGNFNGNNYEITGLTINRSTDNVGLFGFIENSTSGINNVKLIDCDIVGNECVGSIVGVGSGLLISNSYCSGVVQGENFVGGIAGLLEESIINNSYNLCNVSGPTYAGGLAGEFSGNISDSYNLGLVEGNYVLGGLAGFAQYCTISNSYNAAAITGVNNSIGGLIGNSGFGVNIYDSYNSGVVQGKNTVGGLVGFLESSTISESYNSGNVEGTYFVGGIIGWDGGNTIVNLYNLGTIIGEINVGGLIGYDTGCIISNAYNAGNVSGESYVGGFIGEKTDRNISNSFNVGNITNTDNNNNSIGKLNINPEIELVYWDTYLTGKNNCYARDGVDSNAGCTPTYNNASAYYGADGIPFSESDLNWSADIWTARDGNYPILSWQ